MKRGEAQILGAAINSFKSVKKEEGSCFQIESKMEQILTKDELWKALRV